MVPAELTDRVWEIVEVADTKGRRHAPLYWSELVDELKIMVAQGFEYHVTEVPPSRCTTQDAKPLLDVVYRDVLEKILVSRNPSDCRIVIDNYGVGPSLCGWLKTIQRAGAEIIPSPTKECPRGEGTHADDNFAEVRAASVIARFHRESALARVPSGVPLGTLNAEFLSWLGRYRAGGRPLPSFLKQWVGSVHWT